jgi:hypothetical protein
MEIENSATIQTRPRTLQKDQKRQNDRTIKKDASHSSILNKGTKHSPGRIYVDIIHDSRIDEKRPVGPGEKYHAWDYVDEAAKYHPVINTKVLFLWRTFADFGHQISVQQGLQVRFFVDGT